MTNYSFDDTIPATNNNPSTDQPGMLINNQSTKSIIGVDHVTFGVDNGGTHTQVTYSSVTSQSTPSAGQAVLYTSTINSQPNLLFLNPLGSSYNNSNTASGNVLLMGGILLQWGTFTISAGQTQSGTISFPITFPNNFYAMTLNPDSSAPTNNAASFTTGGTGNRQNFVAYRPGTTGTITYKFIAIGN